MVSRLRRLPAYSKTPIIGICNDLKLIHKNPKSFEELSDFLEEPLEKTKLIALIYQHLNLYWQDNSTQILKFPQQKRTRN